MTYYRALAAEPELLDIGWDILETVKFIKLARYLKPYIASMVRLADSHEAPALLPVSIHDFFVLSLGISDASAKVAWDGLRAAIWEGDDIDDPITAFSKVSEYTGDLLKYGIPREIGKHNCSEFMQALLIRNVQGAINLFPPTRTCPNASCSHSYKTSRYYFEPQELTNEKSYSVTVFTRNCGPLPGFAASLACPGMLIKFPFLPRCLSLLLQCVTDDITITMLSTRMNLFVHTTVGTPFN